MSSISGLQTPWGGIDLSTQPDLPKHVERVVTTCQPVQTIRAITQSMSQLLNDPRARRADVARLILRKPSLAAETLRIVNALYRHPTAPAASLTDALLGLHARDLRVAVMTAAASGGFPHRHPLPDFLWKHSVATAAVAREIARADAPEVMRDAFLMGLLHNIGKLALLNGFPGRYSQALLRSLQRGDSLTTVEIQWLDTTHAEVGATILMECDFDDDFVRAMRLHHCLGVPTRHPVSPTATSLTRILRLAEDMVDGQLDRRRGLRAARVPFESPARAFFQWSDEDYIDLWNICRRRHAEILPLF